MSEEQTKIYCGRTQIQLRQICLLWDRTIFMNRKTMGGAVEKKSENTCHGGFLGRGVCIYLISTWRLCWWWLRMRKRIQTVKAAAQRLGISFWWERREKNVFFWCESKFTFNAVFVCTTWFHMGLIMALKRKVCENSLPTAFFQKTNVLNNIRIIFHALDQGPSVEEGL